MTKDLSNLPKPELNALLAAPLTDARLKKTPKAHLVAMVEAGDRDGTPNMTDLERRVLVAYLQEGIASNGADTCGAMQADNMTWSDVPTIAKAARLTQKQVQGVIASLSLKGLLVITEEGVNGEGPVQQVLSDSGIRIAFDLHGEGIKPSKAPRTLKPHVFCEPVEKPQNVTALKEGTKKHKLAVALTDGATLEELMAATGWNRATVQSAFALDMKNSGFGVERRVDQKYYLLMPEGLKCLPVRKQGQSRADALDASLA